MPQLWQQNSMHSGSNDASTLKPNTSRRRSIGNATHAFSPRNSMPNGISDPKKESIDVLVQKEIANLRLMLYTDLDQLMQDHDQHLLEQFAKSHQQVVKMLYSCIVKESIHTELVGQHEEQHGVVVTAPVEVQREEEENSIQVINSGVQIENQDGAKQAELSTASSAWQFPTSSRASELIPNVDQNGIRGSTRNDVRKSKKSSQAGSSMPADAYNSEEAIKKRAEHVAHIRSSANGVQWNESPPPTLQSRVYAIVSSMPFEVFISLLVMTNLLFVAVQVEYSVAHPNDPHHTGIQVVEYLYMWIFFCELLARIFAEGYAFFYGKQWPWNWIDFVIVLFSAIELCGNLANTTMGQGNMTYLRIVRVARTIRVIRVVRIMRFFRALRILVYSILCTLKSLLWTMLLLILIIYVFGIVFTSSTGEYLALKEEADRTLADELLQAHFGTIPRAIFTLFKSVTNGQDWGELTEYLTNMHWVLTMLFVMYIAFTYFAVLNVVTGVFCQSAIESAQLDQDMVVQAQIARKEEFVNKLKRLFHDIDTQCFGTLTLSEFEERLKDDQVAAFFATLELEVSDAWTLFKLLDADETHVISIEDFVVGCLRLKGQAKSIDIAKMMYENQWMMKKLENFVQSFEERTMISPLPTKLRSSNGEKTNDQGEQVAPHANNEARQLSKQIQDELRQVSENGNDPVRHISNSNAQAKQAALHSNDHGVQGTLHGSDGSRQASKHSNRQVAWSSHASQGDRGISVPSGCTPVLPMQVTCE